MARPTRLRLIQSVAAVAGAIGLTASAAGALPHASPSAVPARAAALPNAQYLSLGDSLATGYRPGFGDDRTGGYLAPVLAHLRKSQSNTFAHNLGCGGETSTTFLTGSRCTYAQGSQMAAAEAFLKRRPNTKLITVSIGGNDAVRCVKGGAIDQDCIATSMQTLTKNYGEIAKRLRAAAPKAQIVLLDNYDVFLGEYVTGAQGQETAKMSLILAHALGGIVAYTAWEGQADVAKVSTAFHSDSWKPRKTKGYGTLPANVSYICDWTYYCSSKDIHPTATGYQQMAKAVIAEL